MIHTYPSIRVSVIIAFYMYVTRKYKKNITFKYFQISHNKTIKEFYKEINVSSITEDILTLD